MGERGREGQNETERKTLAAVLAANGMLRLCTRAWVGARVLALRNDGGPGPGLMRCFRDNASRRVDM